MVPELTKRLETGRDSFLRALDGISEEQARRKPASGGWSILECVEHVALAERGMLRMTQKAPVSDPPTPTDLERDAKILKMGGDRSRKAQSPEVAMPTGRWPTLAEAVAQFRLSREQTLAYVNETSEQSLRQKAVAHPLAGTLDGYQVLLLMSVHTERHVGQIRECRIQNAE